VIAVLVSPINLTDDLHWLVIRQSPTYFVSTPWTATHLERAAGVIQFR
jgi:hypothetical protein